MDSRLIYESSKIYLQKIEWLKSSIESESEWIYLNFEENINENVIGEIISNHLDSENLFIALTRNESFETKQKNIMSEIKGFLKTKDFVIWNQQFEKVIEFNKLGICRKGEKASL
jgi:hypothetical protein